MRLMSVHVAAFWYLAFVLLVPSVNVVVLCVSVCAPTGFGPCVMAFRFLFSYLIQFERWW